MKLLAIVPAHDDSFLEAAELSKRAIGRVAARTRLPRVQ